MVLQQPVASTELKKIAPPGPPALPLVGSLPFLPKYSHFEFHKLAKKYGNICQLHVGDRNVIVLSDLDILKEALVKQQDVFKDRADFDIFKEPPQSSFMEFKSGEFWKKHRDVVSQVMHNYFAGKSDTIEDWAIEEAEDLANLCLGLGGQPFKPRSYLPLALLSFMQRIMFGQKGSLKDSEENTDFVEAAHSVMVLSKAGMPSTKLSLVPTILHPFILVPNLKQLLKVAKASGAIVNYVAKNVEQHKNSLDPENLRDFTDGLLKASSEQTDSDRENFRLGDNDIVNGTLCQFAAAGNEVPVTILDWAILYMIAYPEIQAEIHKELDEVVGREQQISLNYRGKLPFTEACITEILRHASPTNVAAIPYSTVRDTTLNGYFIPEKSIVFANYYSLTRDERYWEKPEEFNPYRFLDENGKPKKELVDKFCPFGLGGRRCIGEYIGRLQIFIFFTNLMQKCQFEKVPGDKLNLKPEPAVFLEAGEYRVTAKPRV